MKCQTLGGKTHQFVFCQGCLESAKVKLQMIRYFIVFYFLGSDVFFPILEVGMVELV